MKRIGEHILNSLKHTIICMVFLIELLVITIAICVVSSKGFIFEFDGWLHVIAGIGIAMGVLFVAFFIADVIKYRKK